MSRNPRIQSLNETLMMVQLNSYMDKFDTEMAKMNKKSPYAACKTACK